MPLTILAITFLLPLLAGPAPSATAGAAVAGRDWRSPTLGPMRWIPGGTFTMGSPPTEAGRDDDEPQHQVTLSAGFLLMDHEVTQAEWEAVNGANPATKVPGPADLPTRGPCGKIGVGPDLPVVCVDWVDAVRFANAVSAREGLRPAYTLSAGIVTVNVGADGYRLPTEAEWERAARGGQDYLFAGADEVCKVANLANPGRKEDYRLLLGAGEERSTFADCDDGTSGPAPVRSYQANGYGLYDMSGNVYEWVWDRLGLFDGDAVDPMGAAAGTQRAKLRVARGGGWYSPPEAVRVAFRGAFGPDIRGFDIGLRLARSVTSGAAP